MNDSHAEQEAYRRRRNAALDALWYGITEDEKAALRRGDDTTYTYPNRIIEPGTGAIHAAQANTRLACTSSVPSRLHQRVSQDAPVGCPACRTRLRMPDMNVQWPMNVASHKSLNLAALYTWYLLGTHKRRHRQTRAAKTLDLLDIPTNVQAMMLPALEAIADMNEDTA